MLSAASRSGLQPRGVGRSGPVCRRTFADEAGAAAGDVDVLADQIGIDARDEVLEVEVDVFHRAVQLGGVVVARSHPGSARSSGSSAVMKVPRDFDILAPSTVRKPCAKIFVGVR